MISFLGELFQGGKITASHLQIIVHEKFNESREIRVQVPETIRNNPMRSRALKQRKVEQVEKLKQYIISLS